VTAYLIVTFAKGEKPRWWVASEETPTTRGNIHAVAYRIEGEDYATARRELLRTVRAQWPWLLSKVEA
jgi:hypothetical protein